MTVAGEPVEAIATNLRYVRSRIAAACDRAGRDATSVRLVGISKTFSMTSVRAAVEAGLTDLGENRVQEALDKVSQSADLNVTWHLVGHLQSNKARRAVVAMSWIHSVDSIGLLERLDRSALDERTSAHVLVQVDFAGEATKHGSSVDETRAILARGARCQAIQIRGLMVLPPWSTDPEQTRPYFRQLADLRDRLIAEGTPHAMMAELSMGMSHDFDVAIEEGATIVRVGTAIFGPRS